MDKIEAGPSSRLFVHLFEIHLDKGIFITIKFFEIFLSEADVFDNEVFEQFAEIVFDIRANPGVSCAILKIFNGGLNDLIELSFWRQNRQNVPDSLKEGLSEFWSILWVVKAQYVDDVNGYFFDLN